MKNKLLNQIFVCLAIIGILIPCFIVPVAADAVDKSVVNLLPATNYQNAIDGDVFSRNLLTPSEYYSNVHSVTYRWNVKYYDLSFQSFCFTIRIPTGKVPDKVQFRPYVNGPLLTATLFSSSGNFLQYKYDGSYAVNYIDIKASWDDGFTGQFAVVDCFGVVADVYSIGTVAYREVRHTLISGVDSYGIISQHNSQELPLTMQRNDGDTYEFYDVIDIGVSRSRLNYIYLDSATILVGMPFADAEFTCYIGDDLKVSEWSTAAIYKVLPVEQAVSHSAKLDSGTGRYHTMYYYSVTVDLTDVDLSGKMLHFTFDVAPVDDDYLRWSVYYLCVEPPVQEMPWYKIFYYWISDLWNGKQTDLKDHISSAVDSLGNDINDSMGSMVNGTSGQNNQVSSDVGKLEGGSDQLGQLTQDMQVEKPEISGNDVSVDALIPQAGINLISTPILTIWNSPTILSILILVVTLILVSFVFFGKKG